MVKGRFLEQKRVFLKIFILYIRVLLKGQLIEKHLNKRKYPDIQAVTNLP